MSPLAFGAVVFACVLGGGLLGTFLRVALPERHLSAESKDLVRLAMGLIATSLALWPLGVGLISVALVLVPWALGCFSSNSTQQARLSLAAPVLAPALMALNTSAIYIGQAAGAASGGWLIAHTGFGGLNWVGFAWLAIAIAVSRWAGRRQVNFA